MFTFLIFLTTLHPSIRPENRKCISLINLKIEMCRPCMSQGHVSRAGDTADGAQIARTGVGTSACSESGWDRDPRGPQRLEASCHASLRDTWALQYCLVVMVIYIFEPRTALSTSSPSVDLPDRQSSGVCLCACMRAGKATGKISSKRMRSHGI